MTQELIWVDKEFAKKYNEMSSESSKKEEQLKILNEYLETVSEASRKEFKTSLECLEEDVVIYKGMMLQIRQAFEKAKNEQLKASYELWERFEEEMPKVSEKISAVKSKLEPLKKELDELNSSIEKINTYKIDKVLTTISSFRNMTQPEREVLSFLVNNFGKE